MSSEEINRFIHEEIMGGCWHEWKTRPGYNPNVPGSWNGKNCEKCGSFTSYNPSNGNPTPYTASLDAIRPVEEKVIEAVGDEKYGVHLGRVIGGQLYNVGLMHDKFYEEFVAHAAMATAEQRATACVNAWKDKGNG